LNPEIRSKFLEAFNKAFSQFGLAEEIDVKRSDEFGALILRVKINGLWSNIKDVGYGVSLQIPIISQSLLANQFGMAEIVLIEQPEVHLHPRLQAKFISTLLEVDDYSSTYFIETHSEHIVRKLQSLVKNKPDKIKSEDISIHYFKRTQDKFEVTQHKINENYRLVPNLPKGFFDTSFEISKELL
jgi:predicted ATPase